MNKRTKKLVMAALIAALTCVATMIIKIPSPLKGYLNLGDCVVLVAGWMLSPAYGFLAAGLGSALADILSAYIIYAPATFVIKGVMAIVAFYGFKLLNKKAGNLASRLISGIAAEIVMILGYFVFEGVLYGFIPSAVNIPANGVQGVAGIVFGIVLMKVFEKSQVVSELKEKKTFVNPLGNEPHPDPCIVYCEKERCYYGISTTGSPLWGDDTLIIHRAVNFEDMFSKSERRIAYKSNADDDTYGYLWAPELHLINGKWYIYTSCENSPEDNEKHIIVLEAKTDSPFDGFKICGHVNRDVFAIDPSVYCDEESGRMYLCSSAVVDGKQVLAIQELKSPAEPVGKMEIIARAELDFELVPPYAGKNTIVEGGYFVKSPNGRLFILYSANGCWSDDYAVGLLEYKGGDMVNETSWEKYPEPVFKKGNGVFGTGHATFFYSPDKTELWITCHALKDTNPSNEPMERFCHCQRVYFDETGFVHIGEPIPENMPYFVPSDKKD